MIWFVLIFLSTYFIMAAGYHFYLQRTAAENFNPDPVTYLVAIQGKEFIEALGYEVSLKNNSNFPVVDLWINEQPVARIIEGCNSVSIIILFVAFMLAFFGKKTTTLLYIFSGAVLIYAINILRIAFLSIGIYRMPQNTDFLHQIIFPLIIYGAVFILWVIWIKIYAKQAKR